ncbi:MAG: toll/interleukin-1 receptor domain-containing protein [Hyphomonadaceae bacterium]
MADVFISYKRADRIWAERISAALSEAGISCWWDTSLVAGEHFNQAIDRELRACRCVVVIWSEAANDSRWVQAEALQAFDRGVLFATNIEDVRLGYPFSTSPSMDLRQEGLEGLIDGVRAKLGEAAAPRKRKFKVTLPGVASVLCLVASLGLMVFGLRWTDGDGEDPIPQAAMIAGWVLGWVASIALFEIVSRRSSLVSAFGGAASAIAGFLASSLGAVGVAQVVVGDAFREEDFTFLLLLYVPFAALFSVLFAHAVRKRR